MQILKYKEKFADIYVYFNMKKDNIIRTNLNKSVRPL